MPSMGKTCANCAEPCVGVDPCMDTLAEEDVPVNRGDPVCCDPLLFCEGDPENIGPVIPCCSGECPMAPAL